MSSPYEKPPHAVLFEMLFGAWTAKILAEVVRLDVPDALVQGPLTADELVRKAGIRAHPIALHRALRACAALGIVTEDSVGRFGPTRLSALLTRDGPGTLKLQTTWYMGKWNQSGQLPEDEIAAGRLDRFGSLDPSEGGNAMRTSISASYKAGGARVFAYGVQNQLQLYSNFTLFARDTESGDQIEQTDDRLLGGFDASYEKRISRGKLQALITAGVQGRADNVET